MRIQSLHDLHFSFPDIDGYWDIQDLVKTEAKLRSLLPSSAETATSSQVEAMTQLARLFSLLGKFNEARELLVISETLLNVLPAEERRRVQVRYYLEEGRFYCHSMFPSRALESFFKAWELSTNFETLDILAIDAAYMHSITLPAKQGKKWLLMAVQRAEASKDVLVQGWLSHLYMALGWQAFDHHEFLKAIEFFEKAQLCSASENLKFIRTLKWCTARSLRALNQFEKSLQIQQEISKELAMNGDSNGYVYLEMAECFQALGQPENCRVHFQLAFEKLKLDKWYSDNFDSDLNRIQKNSKNRK